MLGLDHKKYFDILQIYRGIAALLVLVFHTYFSFAHYLNFDIKVLAFIAEIGKLGVDFFFVLSGFIIAYTTFEYRGDKSYVKKYLLNRIIRVYIPYLPISIALFLFYYFFPNVSGPNRSISLLASLTLFPAGNLSLLVAWTLIFEMIFYIVFAINFFSKKGWFYFLAFWIFGIVYSTVTNQEFSLPIIKFLFNIYNLEFIMGIFIAYLIQYQIRLKYSYLLSGAIFLFFLFLIIKYLEIDPFPFFQNLLFSTTASSFIFLGVLYWSKKINVRNVFMMIGNSSYSLYLLHLPLQSLLVRIFPKSESQFIILIEFFVVIIFIVFISYLYYFIFENKIIFFLKSKLKNHIS